MHEPTNAKEPASQEDRGAASALTGRHGADRYPEGHGVEIHGCLTSEEFESEIREQITALLNAGVPQGMIVIRYAGLKWRWSDAIGAWDRFEEEAK